MSDRLLRSFGGAAALAVKAYAYWKEGRRLVSHRELWEYKTRVVRELGEWVRNAWVHANAMHTCFYKGLCQEDDVKAAIIEVERLVKAIKERVKGS